MTLLLACGPPSPRAEDETDVPVPPARVTGDELIDARITPEVISAWRYRRLLVHDLDADGADERVVVTADVELGSEGRPLWEDGHRWAVLVMDGRDTIPLYTGFVPNGNVRVGLAGDEPGSRDIIVLVRSPHAVDFVRFRYRGSTSSRVIWRQRAGIERWAVDPDTVEPIPPRGPS